MIVFITALLPLNHDCSTGGTLLSVAGLAGFYLWHRDLVVKQDDPPDACDKTGVAKRAKPPIITQ